MPVKGGHVFSSQGVYWLNGCLDAHRRQEEARGWTAREEGSTAFFSYVKHRLSKHFIFMLTYSIYK